jgi:hypothetical protein
MWMSKHIITKSEGFKKHRYVDAAGVIRRLFILPGEVFLFIQTKKKSAEVIVVAVTSLAFREQQGGLTKQRRTER